MNLFDEIGLYASNEALICESGKHISYGDLLEMADGIGKVVSSRCLVFAVCQNCMESIAGYLGFLRNRIVPVLLGDDINADLYKALLDTYKPSFIWRPANKVSKNRDIIYCLGGYVLEKTMYQAEYELHADLGLLLTTSGSTGSPKLVRQTYKNITSNAHSIVQYLDIEPSDRAITTLPMSYTYGLSIINSHLLKGATLILTGKTLMEKEFWKQLKEYKATTFGGVPYTYEILKKLRFERMNLLSIRYLTQAGGRLGPELSAEYSRICAAKGIKFIVMYGQTEATARMSYLPWEYAQSKAGSIGIAIPGGEFWLENANGERIEESEVVGELVYKGDNVSMGYAVSYQDLAKGDENYGILHTGDIAKKDRDGFYYIVGRKKRFLKMFGSRINLDEVEQLLKQKGIDCACGGVDDKMMIYITEESSSDIVSDVVINHIGIAKSGIQIKVIGEIPRNEAGKTLYSALK